MSIFLIAQPDFISLSFSLAIFRTAPPAPVNKQKHTKNPHVFMCIRAQIRITVDNLLRKLSNNRAWRENVCACGCFAAAFCRSRFVLKVRWHVSVQCNEEIRKRVREQNWAKSRKGGGQRGGKKRQSWAAVEKKTVLFAALFRIKCIWNSHFCHLERKF